MVVHDSQKTASGSGSGRVRRTLVWLAGGVIVGAVGSGIWDVVAKPGLNRLGSGVLSVLTLGSVTVRDLPYSIAPLNPYSLPPLVLLSLLVLVVLPLFVIMPLADAFLRPVLIRLWQRQEQEVRSGAEAHDDTDALVKSHRMRRRKRWAVILASYSLLLFGFAYVSFGILNRAIALRRVHDANMDIVAPYISADERLRFQAQFALTTKRSEYELLRSRLQAVAEANGVALRSEIVR